MSRNYTTDRNNSLHGDKRRRLRKPTCTRCTQITPYVTTAICIHFQTKVHGSSLISNSSIQPAPQQMMESTSHFTRAQSLGAQVCARNQHHISRVHNRLELRYVQEINITLHTCTIAWSSGMCKKSTSHFTRVQSLGAQVCARKVHVASKHKIPEHLVQLYK